jgi:hypothetical protein
LITGVSVGPLSGAAMVVTVPAIGWLLVSVG